MFVSTRIILFSLLVINAAKSIQAGAEGALPYKVKEYNLMIEALKSLDIASPPSVGDQSRVEKYKTHYNEDTGKVRDWGKFLGPDNGYTSYGYKQGIQKLSKDLEANKNRISAERIQKMTKLSSQVALGRAESSRDHGGGDKGHLMAVEFMTGMKNVMSRIQHSLPKTDLSPALPKSGAGTIANFQKIGSSSSSTFVAAKTQHGASWSSVAALNHNSMPSGSQLRSATQTRPSSQVGSQTTQRTTTRKPATRNTTPSKKRS